jgi:hypothetical protein
MKLTPKVAGLTLAVLAVGGVASGTAFASVHAPKPTPATSIQQGNHASPHTTGSGAGENGTETADDKAGENGTEKAGEKAGENGSEKADEKGGEKESPTDSDGPGGHADPAGDVQHEATGKE